MTIPYLTLSDWCFVVDDCKGVGGGGVRGKGNFATHGASIWPPGSRTRIASMTW